MNLKIEGQILSGKNAMQVTRQGRHYPLPRFVAWRSDVYTQLKKQHPVGWKTIDDPCSINFDYWPGDLRRRDVPGMIDAVFHCLEHFGVIQDDSLFVNVKWSTHEINREHPALSIEIF